MNVFSCNRFCRAVGLLVLLWGGLLPACHGMSSAATPDDSIADAAALLAARGHVDELRPLYEDKGHAFPRDVRLYCEMALARADHQETRLLACIDTLMGEYSRKLGLKGHLSLALLKAETLRNLGCFGELVAYCDKELAYFRGRKVKRQLLEPFCALREKGLRLSGDTPRTCALRLADRDKAFDLSAQYAPALSAFDGYARLRCGLTLAKAYNRPAEAAACAGSLLAAYADSLDSRDYRMCVETRAQALAYLGKWRELGRFVDEAERSGKAVPVVLKHYRVLSKAFQNCPETAVEHPEHDCVWPVTYDYPPLIKGDFGNNMPLYFSLSTGLPHTVIPASDTIMACGLQQLPDTLYIMSALGPVKARPALARQLTFGGITFRNLLLYVAETPRQEGGEPGRNQELLRTLGMGDLARLGILDYYGEKVVVRHAASKPSEKPNLRLSTDGTLLLKSADEGQNRIFSLNTSYPANLLSPAVFPEEDSPVLAVETGGTVVEAAAVVPETHTPGSDGLLGLPFFHRAFPVRMDFVNMKLTGRFDGSSAVVDETSPLFIGRNLPAIARSEAFGQKERMDISLLLAAYKGNDEAFLKQADEYLGLREALGLSDEDVLAVLAMKQKALVRTGRYGEAAALKYPQTNGHKDLKGVIEQTKCQVAGLPAMAVPAVEIEEEALVPYIDKAEKTLPATVNRRETEVKLALSLDMASPVVMSYKTAKHLKVRLFGPKKTAVKEKQAGLIDSLRIGNTVFRNILCTVLPAREQETAIGFGLLSLLDGVRLTRQGVQPLMALPSNKTAVPFVFDLGLVVEGETLTGYADVFLTEKSAGSGAAGIARPVATGQKGMEIMLCGQPVSAAPRGGTAQEYPGYSGGNVAGVYGTEVYWEQLLHTYSSVTLDFRNMLFGVEK